MVRDLSKEDRERLSFQEDLEFILRDLEAGWNISFTPRTTCNGKNKRAYISFHGKWGLSSGQCVDRIIERGLDGPKGDELKLISEFLPLHMADSETGEPMYGYENFVYWLRLGSRLYQSSDKTGFELAAKHIRRPLSWLMERWPEGLREPDWLDDAAVWERKYPDTERITEYDRQWHPCLGKDTLFTHEIRRAAKRIYDGLLPDYLADANRLKAFVHRIVAGRGGWRY